MPDHFIIARIFNHVLQYCSYDYWTAFLIFEKKKKIIYKTALIPGIVLLS